jgi:hypothetical protein
MSAYLEMQSYVKDLRRYRPTIKIKTMIDAAKKQPKNDEMKRKKRDVIKGWFQLVLWYVRLRRSSKGQFCSQLMELQVKMGNVQNPIQKAKAAKVPTGKVVDDNL